jgi:uncharacterized membrane protein
LGFIGSFLGAGFIAWIGGFVAGGLVVAAGFVGSFVDSLLGGSIQAKFTCSVCTKETEKRSHCGERTHHSVGFKWLDNDGVNFVNTIVGAVVVLFFLNYYQI